MLAAALALALPLATPAFGEEATPAQRLTGQTARAVMPAEPANLRLATPGGFWASGEAVLGEPSPAEGGDFRDASLSLGVKREMALSPTLAASVAPQLRLEAGPAPAPGAAPVLGAALQQELALVLPRAITFTAVVAVAERLGGIASATGGMMLRSRATLATQGAVAGRPVQAELQFAATRAVADHAPDRGATCELALAVRWNGGAPVRLAGSCPGEAVARVTIGISASF